MTKLSPEIIQEFGITKSKDNKFHIGSLVCDNEDQVIGAIQTFSPIGSEARIGFAVAHLGAELYPAGDDPVKYDKYFGKEGLHDAEAKNALNLMRIGLKMATSHLRE